MTQKQIHLFTRLKRLGFAKGNQMKLYGQVYEVVLLDATETKSGQLRRVRLPLPIVKMASAA